MNVLANKNTFIIQFRDLEKMEKMYICLASVQGIQGRGEKTDTKIYLD